MSEPVVVRLPVPWPSWFSNAQTSIPNESFDAVERRQIYKDWWLARYGVSLDFDGQNGRWLMKFPDRETYVQCVLTWS